MRFEGRGCGCDWGRGLMEGGCDEGRGYSESVRLLSGKGVSRGRNNLRLTVDGI